MEAREVPPTAPIRAGDVPMHALTSIVHGIFILLLRKVLLAQGGRHGMLLLLPQTEDSFTARRFGFLCDDGIGSLY